MDAFMLLVLVGGGIVLGGVTAAVWMLRQPKESFQSENDNQPIHNS